MIEEVELLHCGAVVPGDPREERALPLIGRGTASGLGALLGRGHRVLSLAYSRDSIIGEHARVYLGSPLAFTPRNAQNRQSRVADARPPATSRPKRRTARSPVRK